VLGALGVAFPVAIFASSLLFLNIAVESMTQVTLEPLKLEQRALATTLNADMTAIGKKLAAVPGVERVDRFAAADVVVRPAGTSVGATARLFAVDPSYLDHNPWVRAVDGSLGQGALLGQSLRATEGFQSADRVSIELAGSTRSLSLTLPSTGTVDLRDTLSAWFAIPIGDVQGDQALVPRALVIDYKTFEERILPALKKQLGTVTPVLNPGLTDLPPVSLEAHIALDHSAFPPDPGSAAKWSNGLRHILERQAVGDIVVADDAFEPLTEASSDASNAKTLFILLGIPGVLAAAALGVAAQSAVAEAHRREEALLRLRGANDGHLARLAGAQAGLAWLIGSALGLAVATAAVTAIAGRAPWKGVPAGSLVLTIALAMTVGALATALRVVRLIRAGKRSEVIERKRLEEGWQPLWRRAWLDVVAISIGAVILAIDIAAGGLKAIPIEPDQGSTLALRFYVLLGLVFLWLGLTLLAVRFLLGRAAKWAKPAQAGASSSWRATSMRWIGRRPARMGVALVLGALAVGFGTQAVTFVATYRAAKEAEAQAAFASDLRLTPSDPTASLPKLPSEIVAVSPIRMVPARAGSDRKTIMTLDLASYISAATVGVRMDRGTGLQSLIDDPQAVLIADEVAQDFEVGPGDPLALTVFPDDKDQSRNIKLRVAGIFRSVPPTNPPAEMVMGSAALPPYLLRWPDFYLARIDSATTPETVASEIRNSPLRETLAVATIADQVRLEPRSLTALNLGPLGDLQAVGAGLIAAIGVAVLGAFLVVERRREFAILQTIGADASQIRTGPMQEGLIAVIGSIAIGVPVGLGLGLLSVRILGLFFKLPPPLLSIPVGTLIGFVAFMLAASAIALWAALMRVDRMSAATILRES
jgi:putative ABC transport system permease protein